jgi:hypothetical protein
MFERGISRGEVAAVIAEGETIAEYPDDTPFPSWLLLGMGEEGPLHVVVAREPQDGACYVVTVYRPGEDQWFPGFRRRRQ